MPETRYREVVTYPEGLSAEERILSNAIITQEPYEISDEQLAEEAEQATCEEYLSHSPPLMTQPEVCYLLRAFAKKLGYKVEE